MTSLLDEDQVQPLIDPNKDYYSELVGEGKKYKDNAALARSKIEGDLYINTLTRRMDEMRSDQERMREEMNAVPALRELVDQLTTQQNQNANREQPPIEREKERTAIDAAQIESLVSSKIQEFQNSMKQEQNFASVQSALQQQYGENYKTTVKGKIEELGVTADFIDQLAKTHPQAAIKMLGLGSQQADSGFQPPVKTTVRTDNFVPASQKRTWSYYENMRINNPGLYNDPKTTVQMHKDYETLGTAFEDGNFHA